MRAVKVIFASSEVNPFAKTGGLADVSSSLPIFLKKSGVNIKVFMPYYRVIANKSKQFKIKVVKKNLKADFGKWNPNFSLLTCHDDQNNMDFYFIDKKEYFDRSEIYGPYLGEYPDSVLRYSFFSNAVLTSSKTLGFRPDILHLNDWHTAMVSFYLKYRLDKDAFFKNSKTLLTIHNLAYQGFCSKNLMEKTGVDIEGYDIENLGFYGRYSTIKAGLLYSDRLNAVSEGYAKEILTKEFGCGLEDLLHKRKNKLCGILNGADYSIWSPDNDSFIKAKYDARNIEDKHICKMDLLEKIKLDKNPDAPLLGMIGRLVEQKGIEVVIDTVDYIMKLGCKLVVLGEGEQRYYDALSKLAKKYYGRIKFEKAFSNEIAHKIEAGADIFVMPSRYEPCGLNQIYSLKYGTIPIVSAVGGLDDTINDYRKDKLHGNGFKFKSMDRESFKKALKSALETYKNKTKWNKLIKTAMKSDFSWKKSALKYIKLYDSMLSGN